MTEPEAPAEPTAPEPEKAPEPQAPPVNPLGADALRLAVEARDRGDDPEVIRDLLLRSLWRPTDPSLVSKLPKGNTMLDYLGHSDTTRVIAEIDPTWEWWPWPEFAALWGEDVVQRDDTGYPRRLYIKLTVLGVERPGIGTVERGKSDPEKELIGDAIRNAAMRFGIGADLWSKAPHGELDSTAGEHSAGRKSGGRGATAGEWYGENGWDGGQDEERRARENLLSRLRQLDPDHAKQFRAWREGHGYKLGDVPSTHDEWADMNTEARRLLAEQKATKPEGDDPPKPPDAPTPPEAPQEPDGSSGAASPPDAGAGESDPDPAESEAPPEPDKPTPPPPGPVTAPDGLPANPEFHDQNDEDDEVACPVCLGGPTQRIDPDCWGCDGRGTVPPNGAKTAEQVLDARAKQAAAEPTTAAACAICGSTRSKTVVVDGVTRCQNGTDCRKRREAQTSGSAGG